MGCGGGMSSGSVRGCGDGVGMRWGVEVRWGWGLCISEGVCESELVCVCFWYVALRCSPIGHTNTSPIVSTQITQVVCSAVAPHM